MKKTKLQRFTVWLLVLTMLLSTVPAGVLPVMAAAPATGGYTYGIEVKTSDVNNAATDDNVYCLVETIYGGTMSFKLDKKGNDFKRNSTDRKSVV